MVWFLAPIIVVATKVAIQAWQEHEAAQQRRREQEAAEEREQEREQQREYERQQRLEQNLAIENARIQRRELTAEAMRHDYHAHFLQLLQDHSNTVHGTVPEPVGSGFSFAELVNLAQAKPPANLNAMILLLKPLLPNLTLAPKHQQHIARIKQLQDEISELQQLAKEMSKPDAS